MLDHCTSLPSAEEMRACSADLTAAREDVFGLTNAALGVTLSMWAGMARIEAWCNRGEVNREIENGIAGLVARILEAPGGIDLAKARQRVDSDLEHGRLSVVCEDVAHVHSQIPLKIQRIMKEQEAIAREIRG